MSKFVEISEEFLKNINFVCDLALKHPHLGGLQARQIVNQIGSAIENAYEKLVDAPKSDAAASQEQK